MITLSSDFGSPYPAAMKGVILDRTRTRLVDIAHDFPRQDVRTAAFWLREILPTFPPAVHLVVVDPGVGTDRRALAVRSGDHALVGPDNGVLLPAARRLGDPDPYEIGVDDPASTTFHGRDVFAPAAAEIHSTGIGSFPDLDGFDPVTAVEDLVFPTPDVTETGARGEVLVVDGFGNAITNIPGAPLREHMGKDVSVNSITVRAAVSYGHVSPGTRLATIGSHGNVELAVNRGRGDAAFDVEPGDAVDLRW